LIFVEGGGMENLYELLFELSNEDRHRILLQLNTEEMTVTSLSDTLNLTKQEVSRHVSRLSNAELTQKRSNGSYHLTPYGKLALKQLDGFDFISQYQSYFSFHSLAHLPNEIIYRIGELKGSQYINDISVTYYNIEKMIQEAEEYVWLITDHYLSSVFPLYARAHERGVRVRTIEAEDWVVPPEINEGYANQPKSDIQIIDNARVSGLLKEGLLKKLGMYLYLSEKEVAIASFPLPDGRFDYLGFSTEDKQGHKWCEDLFMHYWERTINRTSLGEELYNWIKERPEAVDILVNVVTGKDFSNDKELLSELEGKSIIKQGKSTILGDIVYRRLQRR